MKKLAEIGTINLIITTLVFLFMAHYLMVFVHEYAHAVAAWLLGYKDSPLDINYGGTSWGNLLMLMSIDQKVNNDLIYSSGHPGYVALIAFAGPGITLLLYFVTYALMQKPNIKQHIYTLYFLFFCNFWALAGTYAYVPIRTFTPSGVMVDILDIEQSLNLSPWLIYFVVGYLVLFMMWQFFTKTMISIYANVGISSTCARAGLMMLCVLVLFGYCGLAGFWHHGDISRFIAVTSFYAMPGLIFVLWPTRSWVQRSLKAL